MATRQWRSFRSDASQSTAPKRARTTSQRTTPRSPPPDLTPSSAMLLHADERDVAVLLRGVETVADDEAVLDLEAEVVDGDLRPRAGRLVEQRAELDRRGVAGGEVVEQVAHGQAGVDDVLDDDHVLVLDRLGEIAGDLDHPRALGGLAVAREADEVDRQRQDDGPGEGGEEEGAAPEDPQQDQGPGAR